MALNNIKHVLSIVSLLSIVVALACFFTDERKIFLAFLVIGVVCKTAEIVIRVYNGRKKDKNI